MEINRQRKMADRILPLIGNNVSIIGLILVLVLFHILTQGRMITGKNLMTIFNQAVPLAIACMSTSFLFSQGGLDLTMGNTTALAAILGARVSGTSFILTILVCIAVSVGISLINGHLYVKLKLPIFILGLSVSFVIGGLLQPLSGFGTVSIPYGLLKYNTNAMKIIVFLVFFLVLGYLYAFTPLGRRFKAIGSSPVAATQAGVQVNKMKRLAFLLNGFTMGILAVLVLLKDGGANYNTGNMTEFNALVALVIGGMPIGGGAACKFRYSVVGALLLTAITNGLTIWGINGNVQSIVKACVFIAVMVLGTYTRKESI